MKRVLITISYDGTRYHGWQVQPNGISVQETIQNTLYKMFNKKIAVTGCSRTDAGVHAKEFCFHIDCPQSLPKSAFLKGLNSVLPDDIKVLSYKEVPDDFHARYSCLGKTYSYGFYMGEESPFLERYYLHLDKKPDIEKMQLFCDLIVGKHDFFAFSSSGRTVEDTVRTVNKCYMNSQGDMIFLKITADGFLYNMVRIIAGTALAVGMGRLSPDCATEMFDKKDRSLGGDTLPPKALFLEKVFYKEDL